MKYPVTEIFYSLQGEGHFVGYPMAFVRLAGCSVQACHIRRECDEAPWKMREMLTAADVLARVDALAGRGIVCITGGEPTDHDLVPLVSTLRDGGQRVHLETSGIRPVTGIPIEWITVSPKTTDHLQRSGHTLKVVVRPEWSFDEAWKFAEDCDGEFFHRYLQPMTSLNGEMNVNRVADMILSGRNVSSRWALSTQAHRSWGLP